MKVRNNMQIWWTSACQSLATSYRPQLTRKKEKEKEKEKEKKGIGLVPNKLKYHKSWNAR